MSFQRFVQILLFALLTVMMSFSFVLYTRAEELPEWESAAPLDVQDSSGSSVMVSSPELVSQLSEIRDILIQISDAVVPADSESLSLDASNQPEDALEHVDYSAQLAEISAQLSAVQQSLQPSTSETAVTDAFSVPFSEYSLTDFLLLFGIVFFIGFSVLRFVVDRWF